MSLGPWSRVKMVVGHFRDGTSPGMRGIPTCVWKLFPDLFFQQIADLLRRVEATGE